MIKKNVTRRIIMGRFPIGVIIDSFRTDTVSAVKKAASVGADGIQVYATRGEMAPENMNAQKRADLRLCRKPALNSRNTRTA